MYSSKMNIIFIMEPTAYLEGYITFVTTFENLNSAHVNLKKDDDWQSSGVKLRLENQVYECT